MKGLLSQRIFSPLDPSGLFKGGKYRWFYGTHLEAYSGDQSRNSMKQSRRFVRRVRDFLSSARHVIVNSQIGNGTNRHACSIMFRAYS